MCSVSFVEKLWRSLWKLQWFLHCQLVHARRALSYNQPLWKKWLQQGFLIQIPHAAVLSWLPPKASASFSQVANHSFWRAALVFRYYKEGRREHEGKDISCFKLLLLTCQLWALCDCVQVPRMAVAVEPSLKMGRDFTRKKWGCPRWGDQLSLRQECRPGSREVQGCRRSSPATYRTGELPQTTSCLRTPALGLILNTLSLIEPSHLSIPPSVHLASTACQAHCQVLGLHTSVYTIPSFREFPGQWEAALPIPNYNNESMQLHKSVQRTSSQGSQRRIHSRGAEFWSMRWWNGVTRRTERRNREGLSVPWERQVHAIILWLAQLNGILLCVLKCVNLFNVNV